MNKAKKEILRMLQKACNKCYMDMAKDKMKCPWRDIDNARCELFYNFKEELCKEKKY